MRLRAVALAALCLMLGTALVAEVATAGPGGNDKPKKGKKHKKKKKKKGKVSICHREGNGSYHLITVGKPAVKAHLGHGDAFPGDTVAGGTLRADCSVQPPSPQVQRFSSPALDFGPNGWAGWSCPSTMKAVGGGHTLVDVTASGVAQPGATIGGSTYPVFPHHTFPAGETGFVVQNDNDTETGVVFVDCVLK